MVLEAALRPDDTPQPLYVEKKKKPLTVPKSPKLSTTNRAKDRTRSEENPKPVQSSILKKIMAPKPRIQPKEIPKTNASKETIPKVKSTVSKLPVVSKPTTSTVRSKPVIHQKTQTKPTTLVPLKTTTKPVTQVSKPTTTTVSSVVQPKSVKSTLPSVVQPKSTSRPISKMNSTVITTNSIVKPNAMTKPMVSNKSTKSTVPSKMRQPMATTKTIKKEVQFPQQVRNENITLSNQQASKTELEIMIEKIDSDKMVNTDEALKYIERIQQQNTIDLAFSNLKI
jgi:hypothetical protein